MICDSLLYKKNRLDFMKIIIVGGIVEQWLAVSPHSKSVVGSHPQASWARSEFACTPHVCMFSPPSVSWDWLQPPNDAAKKSF